MSALLTDNLPLLAGSPNGIQKLRELILELAVRGKLVPQDPSDEPASELLKRIAEEKAQLVAEGKVRKQKPLVEIGEEEKPFELPERWEWASTAGLTLLITDGTHHTPKYVASGVPFISVKDIDGATVSFDNCKYISPEEHSEINSRCNPEKGDILLCRIGTLGRPTIVDADIPFSLFVSVGLLKLPKKVDVSRYLHCALSSPLMYRQYDKIKAGGSHTNKLNLGDIPRLLVPLPPLAEQHRIVAKVDELMALCNRLEARQADSASAHARLVQALLDSLTQARDADDFAANWQRLAEHFHSLFTSESSIDALKQTLLQLAVMGKLVPQDPSDEPASELLKRIAEEKVRLVAEGRIRKQKPLAEISEEEKPFELPGGWEWARFDAIADTRLGKMLDKAKNQGEPKKYLRNTNVQWFRFELNDLKTMKFESHELDDFRVLAGDLIVCEGGEPGRCAVWREQEEQIFFQKALHRARPWLGISSHYLQFCLRAANDSGTLEKLFTGATIKHLPGEKLAKWLVALPPLAEQHRIVAKVNQLMTLCDQLKSRLTAARQLHERLAGALVEQTVA